MNEWVETFISYIEYAYNIQAYQTNVTRLYQVFYHLYFLFCLEINRK